jgi:hypothetical protein
VPVDSLPVSRDLQRHAPQDMRRQVLDLYPGQDQESRVVSDEAEVATACFGVPTDVAVATAQMTYGRGPCQAGDRPPLPPHQVLQVFSRRLLVAEIMMFLQQTVPQRFFPGAPHQLELQRLEVAQTVLNGRGINPHRLWPGPVGQRVMPHITHRRQLDLAGTFQHQQQAAAHHVAQRAIGLAPLPGFTELGR